LRRAADEIRTSSRPRQTVGKFAAQVAFGPESRYQRAPIERTQHFGFPIFGNIESGRRGQIELHCDWL
jgi:hypothetical protein